MFARLFLLVKKLWEDEFDDSAVEVELLLELVEEFEGAVVAVDTKAGQRHVVLEQSDVRIGEVVSHRQFGALN